MVRRKDLVDIGDKNYKSRTNEIILCNDCGDETGGTRGDFFMVDMNYILKCPQCQSTALSLVKKVYKYITIKE